MRLPQLASTCLLAALLDAQSTQDSPSAAVTATLTAISPITAAWVNAPVGSAGAVVTHPAGPLSSANLSAPIGMGWANFVCNLAPTPNTAVLTATSLVFAPPGEVVQTHADLLLVLTAPASTLGTIDLGLAHLGDTPSPLGFRVDLGNDGSEELNTASQYCCGTVQRRVFTRSFANGPWLVRIRNDNVLAASPQAYDLRLEFQVQLAGVTDLGGDCGTPITTPPTTVVYSTNSHLTALPSNVPNEFGLLRAVGFGHISLFLFAEQPSLVALPLPPFGTCDLLAAPQFGDPGIVTSGTAVPSEWTIHLPGLPPGLTFHCQHAWLNLATPLHLGASNVLRINT